MNVVGRLLQCLCFLVVLPCFAAGIAYAFEGRVLVALGFAFDVALGTYIAVRIDRSIDEQLRRGELRADGRIRSAQAQATLSERTWTIPIVLPCGHHRASHVMHGLDAASLDLLVRCTMCSQVHHIAQDAG